MPMRQITPRKRYPAETGLPRRKVQMKRRPVTRFRLGNQLGAQQLGALAGDAQAQAHSLLAVRLAALERGEELLQRFGCDARPAVGDGDADAVIGAAAARDL